MENKLKIFSADLHGDILMDVVDRRLKRGEEKVLINQHLTPLRKGGVRIQVLPIFINSTFLPESALRQALRMISALYAELREAVDEFLFVNYRDDLEEAIKMKKIALILAFEGADPLDRDLDFIHLFYKLGLRMISLTWNRANQYAQGPAENTGAGVSVLGRELLHIMDELGIILDLSHLSTPSFWSALEHYHGPVVASHSNAIRVANHPRNLEDEQIKAIGDRGGLIGLNFIPRFVGDSNLLQGLLRHAEHIRDIVGVSCLALGPDFINYLPETGESPKIRILNQTDPELQDDKKMPDVTMLPDLWHTFLNNGWSQQETALVFGENARRFFNRALPIRGD